MRRQTAKFVALFVWTMGCSQWHVASGPAPDSPLSTPKLPKRSMAFEIAIIRLPPDMHTDDWNELWAEVDEQVLPLPLRERQRKNGLQVGRISGHTPAAIQRLLEDSVADGEAPGVVLTDLNRAAKAEIWHQQLGPGDQCEIALSQHKGAVPILLSDADGRIGGKNYDRPQAMLSMANEPLEDGRVRVVLTPKIRHGDVKQNVVSQEIMLRMTWERDSAEFPWLACEVDIAPGDVLAVGARGDSAGDLGSFFFRDEMGDQRTGKLLLIRLAQTQHDEWSRGTRELPREPLSAQ